MQPGAVGWVGSGDYHGTRLKRIHMHQHAPLAFVRRSTRFNQGQGGGDSSSSSSSSQACAHSDTQRARRSCLPPAQSPCRPPIPMFAYLWPPPWPARARARAQMEWIKSKGMEVSFYGDGTLLQAVRILRTTLADGHLMFSDTLLLKITMDILFVDALASRG